MAPAPIVPTYPLVILHLDTRRLQAPRELRKQGLTLLEQTRKVSVSVEFREMHEEGVARERVERVVKSTQRWTNKVP